MTSPWKEGVVGKAHTTQDFVMMVEEDDVWMTDTMPKSASRVNVPEMPDPTIVVCTQYCSAGFTSCNVAVVPEVFSKFRSFPMVGEEVALKPPPHSAVVVGETESPPQAHVEFGELISAMGLINSTS